MKNLIKVLLILSLPICAMGAAPKSHDDLLKRVIEERGIRKVELKKREQKFINEKQNRTKMLGLALKDLKSAEARTKKLTSEFETNEKKLGTLEDKLTLAMGVLGELFGVVRQVSGDFSAQIKSSVISAQVKGRNEFLTKLTQKKQLPTIEGLEQLWFELQREMTESGKVLSFKSPVVLPNGTKSEKTVTRVGSFNLVSDGKYLDYQFTTGQLVEIPRQPSRKFMSLVEDFEEGKAGPLEFGLDPSRGSILSMLVQTPNLKERVEQGGVVGFVILFVLLIGIVIVIERMFTLSKETKKVKAQMQTQEIDESNFLGRLIKVYRDNKDKDLKTMELKLDESIVKSLPKIEKGIPTIKILAAVAPLLGLLGTVTGMISTFQSITLFGTGDPKLMAGGISTALVTTVLGLVCAIPLVLLHNVVSNKSKNLLQILEEQSAGIIATMGEQEGAKA